MFGAEVDTPNDFGESPAFIASKMSKRMYLPLWDKRWAGVGGVPGLGRKEVPAIWCQHPVHTHTPLLPAQGFWEDLGSRGGKFYFPKNRGLDG